MPGARGDRYRALPGGCSGQARRPANSSGQYWWKMRDWRLWDFRRWALFWKRPGPRRVQTRILWTNTAWMGRPAQWRLHVQ